MRFELYKIFKKRVVLILICVGLVWGLFSALQPALEYTTYTEQMDKLTGIKAIRYDRDLQNKYAGRYSMEELRSLYKKEEDIYNNQEYQRPEDEDGGYSYSDASGNTTSLTDEAYYKHLNRYNVISLVGSRTFYNPRFVKDLIATGDLTEFYLGSIVRYPGEEKLIPSPDSSTPIVKKLVELYDDLQYPFKGAYINGWEDFFNTIPVFFPWMVGLIIVIGIVPMFAEETSSGSDKVLLTTRYGKTRMIRDKIAAGFLYASFVFLLFAVFFIALYTGIYGASGLSASIQLLGHCKLSPYDMSINQALIGWVLWGWLAALMISAETMLFSSLASNTFAALIPSFIVYIVPMMGFAEISPKLHRVLQLLPVNIIGDVDRLFSMPDYYTIFGSLVEKKILIVFVGIAAVIICSLLSAVIFKKKEASN